MRQRHRKVLLRLKLLQQEGAAAVPLAFHSQPTARIRRHHPSWVDDGQAVAGTPLRDKHRDVQASVITLAGRVSLDTPPTHTHAGRGVAEQNVAITTLALR